LASRDGFANNYFAFKNGKKGLFEMVPWDLDKTLGLNNQDNPGGWSKGQPGRYRWNKRPNFPLSFIHDGRWSSGTSLTLHAARRLDVPTP